MQCQREKPAQNTRVGFQSSDMPTASFERLFIDHISTLPLSKNGNKYLLTVVDAFLNVPFYFLHETLKLKQPIISSRKTCSSYFLFHKILVTDYVPSFKSASMTQMFQELRMQHISTSSYYHNLSHAERVNTNLKVALRVFHSRNQSIGSNSLLTQPPTLVPETIPLIYFFDTVSVTLSN